MRRYIDTDKLKSDIKEIAKVTGGNLTEFEVLGILSGQPIADVVEVVRCKDCRWWDNEDDAERCTHEYCSMWAKPNGYCSYGERADT